MPTTLSAGHNKLALLLRLVFRRQALDVQSRLSLDAVDRGQAPDLTPWVRAVAESVKPVLLGH